MRRSTRLVLVATAVIAGAAPAMADQEPPVQDSLAASDTPAAGDADLQAARDSFLRGVALAQASNWEEARSAFARSNRLRPHAVTLYNVAFCEKALGQYTRAARDFEAALRGDDSAGTTRLPPELEAMARRDLHELEGELSTAVLVVHDRSDRLLVDGRPLAPAGEHEGRPVLRAGTREPGPPERLPAGTLEVRLDPGTHVFRLFREHEAPLDAARTLRPAETTLVNLSTPAPSAPMPTTPDASPPGNSKRLVAYWVLGGAAAGAAVAATFGTLALMKHSELASACPGHVCGPDHASDVSRLGLYGDLTTAGLAVAGVGLAVGGYLLATSSSSHDQAQARSPQHVDLRFSFGVPASVSVDGVF